MKTDLLSLSLEGDVSCEFGSAKYYALCGFGGILSCGLTHTAVVPLDLVKCRIQVSSKQFFVSFDVLLCNFVQLSVIIP